MEMHVMQYGYWRTAAALAVIAVLVACGGGSGAGSANSGNSSGSTGAHVSPNPMPGDMPPARTVMPVMPNDGMPASWSDPALWNGKPPRAGDLVMIPAGMRVELDTSTPKLRGLMIEGQLIVKPGAQLSLTSDYIMVSGSQARFEAGSTQAPFSGQLDIVLSGTDPQQNIMGMGAKVFMAEQGGTVALFGMRKRAYSRLNASIASGANYFELSDDPNGWKIGDTIAVAPTDFDALQAEQRKITAIAGRLITVDQPFTHAHWGQAPEIHGGKRLDMRAHVGNLSRNIRLSSIENEERLLPGFNPESRDSSGLQNGAGKRPGLGRFGGHMMIMRNSFGQFDSIEVTQWGQQGMLGRYPIHWHLPGDSSREGNFIRHSSVHQTFQRAVVLHQANGVEIEDNVLFDIPGHGIYIEDGIEHDNVIDRNLIMLIRYVPRRHRLSVLDTEKDRAEKLSGMWITNPANLIRDNVVAGVQNGWGYIFGNVLDDKIPVISKADRNWADNRSYAGFSGNTAYAIGFMQSVPDGGDSVFNLGYGPEEAGSCFRFNFPGDYARSQPSSNLTAFKCRNAAFWSTNFLPIKNAIVADSRSAIVNNQGENGISELQDALVVGITANNPAGRADFTFGPFAGPVLKEHLESGPVTFNNVVTAYRFLEGFDGLAPAINASRSATASFKLVLPEYASVKADGSVNVPIRVDRSSGFSGSVRVSLAIPKPPNLAEENPYFEITSTAVEIPSGSDTGVLVLNNGAAQRAGSQVVVVQAQGDATVLNTLRLLTATRPTSYLNAANGNNLSRLISADSPRNPQMSSVVQNAGGSFAVDGNLSSAARFEPNSAPWIRLDLDRSYNLDSIVIEWDPAYRPQGELLLSLSEFAVLTEQRSMADVLALAPSVATSIRIPDQGQSRVVIPWPAGTSLRQAKLWVTQTQTQETRLREISLISR
jgi:hypothetical protein